LFTNKSNHLATMSKSVVTLVYRRTASEGVSWYCPYGPTGPILYVHVSELYGCETWSLTLKEEHKLRVFENRVLRRIFGLKRDEVTGG
jgi:hypothetical protein